MAINCYTNLDEQLRESCCGGDTDAVYRLINSGADVNSQNKMNGWTSLHWAAKRGHKSVVSILLKNHADASIKNNSGETAADVTCDQSTLDILRSCEILKNNSCTARNIEEDVRGNEKDEKVNQEMTDNPKTEFVPNYLLNPVFPHLRENMHTPVEQLRSDVRNASAQMATAVPHNVDELVLKVKEVTSSDFIEVELELSELTYDNLLNICCRELDIEKDNVTKIRKLPNTILRKDKDVKRLIQFQELEVVTK